MDVKKERDEKFLILIIETIIEFTHFLNFLKKIVLLSFIRIMMKKGRIEGGYGFGNDTRIVII